MNYKDVAASLPWSKGVKLLACDSNGLFAVEKPSGLLSHPNRSGERTKAILPLDYSESLQAYEPSETAELDQRICLLNRLDSATSGVLLLALSEQAAAAVRLAFEKKQVRKTYVALVFGYPRDGRRQWTDRLSVKRQSGQLRAAAGEGSHAQTRLLKAQQIPGSPLLSRLTLQPITGRTHQLRIQCAKRNLPIVGDRTYGDFAKNKQIARCRGLKRLFLHCQGTELAYELSGARHRFSATSEPSF